MKTRSLKIRRLLVAGALTCGFSGAAWAFPWDIDMVDAYFWRAYEWVMMPLPEGVVSTNYTVAPKRGTPEGDALESPVKASAETLATGQKMFEVYCQTCHGVDGVGGAPVTKGPTRYTMPPPKLSGQGSIVSRYSDGYLYLTIRNGGSVMPGYGTSMDDREMWAVVTYMRKLNGR